VLQESEAEADAGGGSSAGQALMAAVAREAPGCWTVAMSATEETTRLYRDTGIVPSPHLRPNGVNHLAISTADIKAQLTFFAEVLGCPTRALYWMHGVPNTFHGFVELTGDSYIAFVQSPDNPVEPQWGVTHAGNAGEPVTAGAMQHVALNVDSIDEVLTMRDRIRSHGIQVFGPLDHGMIQSIYFAGPEGLSLEICTGRDIDEQQWIDPEVQALCGISSDELARLVEPAPFTRPDLPVPQPSYDPSVPNMHYPDPVREFLMGMPDEDVWRNLSEPTPPVTPDRAD
jgi:catechol 2,3-dioxygenase-like lactoylglutathione lyase family enzyme